MGNKTDKGTIGLLLGFLKRMQTRAGRLVLKRRRNKGRTRLAQ